MYVFNARRKLAFTPLAVMLVSAGLLMYGMLTRGHAWGDDFAAYIMQAESLCQGSPQNYLAESLFTETQSFKPMGPVAYPWGYPMLLAPVYAIFGLNVLALKMVGVISYLGFIVVLWYGFQNSLSRFWNVCLGMLFALNPAMLSAPNRLESDLPFLLFSTLSVILIQHVVVGNRAIFSTWADYALIGLTITAAFLARTNGILLLATLGFTQMAPWLIKQYRDYGFSFGNFCSTKNTPWWRCLTSRSLLLPFVPYVTFFCLALLCESILPKGGATQVTGLQHITLLTIKKNINYYLYVTSQFYAGVPHQQFIYAASVPLAIAGIFTRWRSTYPALVYSAATIMLYIIWPFQQGLRFVYPILPFYLFYVLAGMQAFQGGATWLARTTRKLVCCIPLAYLLFFFGLLSLRDTYYNISRHRTTSTGPFTPTSENMFSFIKSQTAPNSTVVFFKPRALRLITGRKSYAGVTKDDLSNADYLCLYLRSDAYNQLPDESINALSGDRDFQQVYTNPDFKVYRLIPERQEGPRPDPEHRNSEMESY